jgi:hypothetical protein
MAPDPCESFFEDSEGPEKSRLTACVGGPR